SHDMKTAYASLESDRNSLKDYLKSKGINEDEIVFSSVNISKNYNNTYDQNYNLRSQVFTGYTLRQNVQIESKEVEKVESISREVSELINLGIELDSYSPERSEEHTSELQSRE